MKRRQLLAISTAAVAAPAVVRAQRSYPTAPVSVLVGLAPGGSADVTMRFITREASNAFGTQVVVDNRPGGAQTIAPARAARAKPDGYTLLQTTSAFGTVPLLQSVPYNIETDFTFITQYIDILFPNYVLADSPWKTRAELIEFAKANPGKLRWAAATPFSAPHLANAAAFQSLGIESIFFPFKGGSEVVAALLAGHIDLVVSSDFAPLVSAGRVRLLSEIGPSRPPGMENIPCFAELGYPVALRSGFGIVGPAGLPVDVVGAWIDLLTTVGATSEWKAMLATYQALPSTIAGDAFRNRVLGDYRRLREILPGLKIER